MENISPAIFYVLLDKGSKLLYKTLLAKRKDENGCLHISSVRKQYDAEKKKILKLRMPTLTTQLLS